ncbi:MAG: hypothetical protein V3S31_01260 [Dehalococcoidia bacterium]
MRSFAALGLGALLCLPCLAVIAGVSLATLGGALATLAVNPVAQATGLLIAVAGLAAARWYARRRACPQCEAERSQGRAAETVRHEMHT